MNNEQTTLPRVRRASTNVGKTLLETEGLSSKQNGPLFGRKTKIICTIGPATKSVEILCKMLKAGMNVARLNFSHGTHEYHKETITNIRKASELTDIPVAVLLDTKGPEIRTGMLENGEPVQLVRGSKIKIHCAPSDGFLGNASDISVDHPKMAEVLEPGKIIKIDDGLILIRVEECKDRLIIGEVLNNQELGEKKGVNLPGVDTGLPALTKKDEEDILFGLEQRVDIIAPSFINCADDVVKIRRILGEEGAYIKIISKIESVKGISNFSAILRESDGIMIARGDLGVEIPIQKVCMAQKTMISQCNAFGKPIVTATQMLDSMIKNPSPTRAEVADVANAVFDGSDCVMLSGESAKGAFPVEAVTIMAKICRRSESAINYRVAFRRVNSISDKREREKEDERTESVTCAAVKITSEVNAALIFALTNTGKTAGYVSKYMPPVPILSISPSALTNRQSLLRKNVWPVRVKKELGDEERFKVAKQIALDAGWCKKGDCVIVVSGKPDVSGSSYMLRVLDV